MEYEKMAEEIFELISKLRFGQQTQPLNSATHGEHFILVYLCRKQCALPGDLAQIMNASTAYIAKLLRGLEEKQLILRRQDEQDRRRTLITLTDAGVTAAQQDMEFVRMHIIQTLEKLGEEDAEHLVRILKKLLASKEEHPI